MIIASSSVVRIISSTCHNRIFRPPYLFYVMLLLQPSKCVSNRLHSSRMLLQRTSPPRAPPPHATVFDNDYSVVFGDIRVYKCGQLPAAFATPSEQPGLRSCPHGSELELSSSFYGHLPFSISSYEATRSRHLPHLAGKLQVVLTKVATRLIRRGFTAAGAGRQLTEP